MGSSTTSSSRADQEYPVGFTNSLTCNKQVNSVQFLLGMSLGFWGDCHWTYFKQKFLSSRALQMQAYKSYPEDLSTQQL